MKVVSIWATLPHYKALEHGMLSFTGLCPEMKMNLGVVSVFVPYTLTAFSCYFIRCMNCMLSVLCSVFLFL